MMRVLSSLLGLLLLTACADTARDISLMSAATPMETLSASPAQPGRAGGEYRIGQQDLLAVNVFQVADLSSDQVRVDSSGDISLPLLGVFRAEGRTAPELSEEIRGRLAERYLRDPQVSVSIRETASQKVTVDGAVLEPGVYEMKGETTLVQAVAMAKGPTGVANLRSVVVFRMTDGTRTVAQFDLAAIRGGQQPDPILLGNDVVVVDSSRLNAAFRDILPFVPLAAYFRPF